MSVGSINPRFSRWISTTTFTSAEHGVEEARLTTISLIQQMKRQISSSQELAREIAALADGEARTALIDKKSQLDNKVKLAFNKIISNALDIENMVVPVDMFEHSHLVTNTMGMAGPRTAFYTTETGFSIKAVCLSTVHENFKERLFPNEGKIGEASLEEITAFNKLKALLEGKHPNTDDEVKVFFELIRAELRKLSSNPACESRLAILFDSLEKISDCYKLKLENPDISSDERKAYVLFESEAQKCLLEIKVKNRGVPAFNELKVLLDAKHPKNDDEVEPFLELVRLELQKLSSDLSCRARVALLANSLEKISESYKAKLKSPAISSDERRLYVYLEREAQKCALEIKTKIRGVLKEISAYFVEHIPLDAGFIELQVAELSYVLQECDMSFASLVVIRRILARVNMLSTLFSVYKERSKEVPTAEKEAAYAKIESAINKLNYASQLYERLALLSRNVDTVRACLKVPKVTTVLVADTWHKFQNTGGLEPELFAIEKDVFAQRDLFPNAARNWIEIKGRLNEISAWLIDHFPKEEEMFAFLAQTRTEIQAHGADPEFEIQLYQRMQTVKYYADLYEGMFNRRQNGICPVIEGFSRNAEFQKEAALLKSILTGIKPLPSLSKRCDQLSSKIGDALKEEPINIEKIAALCKEYTKLEKDVSEAVVSAEFYSTSIPKILADASALDEKMKKIPLPLIDHAGLEAALQDILNSTRATVQTGYGIVLSSASFKEEVASLQARMGELHTQTILLTTVFTLFRQYHATHPLLAQNTRFLREKSDVFDSYFLLLHELAKEDAADEKVILKLKQSFESGMTRIKTDLERNPASLELPGYASYKESMQRGLDVATAASVILSEKRYKALFKEVDELLAVPVKDSAWIIQAETLKTKIVAFNKSNLIPADKKTEMSQGLQLIVFDLQNEIYEIVTRFFLENPMQAMQVSDAFNLINMHSKDLVGFAMLDAGSSAEYDAFKARLAHYTSLYSARRESLQRLVYDGIRRFIDSYRDELKEVKELKKNLTSPDVIALFNNIFTLRASVLGNADALKGVVDFDLLKVELEQLVWFKSVISFSLTAPELSAQFDGNFNHAFQELIFNFTRIEKAVIEDTTPSVIKDLILAEITEAKAQIEKVLRLYIEHVFKAADVPIPAVAEDEVVPLLNPFSVALAHFSREVAIAEAKAGAEKQDAASALLKKLNRCEAKLAPVARFEACAIFSLREPLDHLGRIRDQVKAMVIAPPKAVNAITLHRVPRNHDLIAAGHRLPFAADSASSGLHVAIPAKEGKPHLRDVFDELEEPKAGGAASPKGSRGGFGPSLREGEDA